MADKPNWFPENPYPEDIFPMTIESYVKAIPYEKQRTAISGCLGRMFFEMFSKMFEEAYLRRIEDGLIVEVAEIKERR